mmetsp:Transcript_1773/g.1653  ORF Transcript_1773/g.1653 Transcript_1773/m.1653 type:complete len:87 (-) Transcript_1773:2175-2435(-)
MSGPEEKELLRMAIKDGNFWINASPDASKSKNKPGEKQEEDWENIDYALWLVVKSFKNPYSNKSGYKLNEGDLIKLGRVKFRIKEM